MLGDRAPGSYRGEARCGSRRAPAAIGLELCHPRSPLLPLTAAMGLLIDGLIIVLYFALITGIGLYMGRREDTLNDFALGGRKIPWWAVMASIIAAETSAATFLGAPGEGYAKQSLAYVQLVFGLILGRVIVGNVFLKPYYDYKVYTVYDYLGVRFGPQSKLFVSALFLVMRTLASGTRLFVPSLVMVLAWRLLTGGHNTIQFNQGAVTSVGPYLVAITLLTIVTCAYTAIGGIKAVIWTDVIQAALMFGSALVAIGTLLYHIGGLGPLVQAVPAMARADGYVVTGFEHPMSPWEFFKNILVSDYTLFSALIGATLGNMAAFGTDQDMVQRMLSAETYKKARRSLITAAVMDLPIAAGFTFIGILLFVYYAKDPTFKPAANSDVFGSYILNVMPVGIRGLVLAGVFATAMGSFSAALNALATSATNDWWILHHPGRSERHYVRAARWFTVVFAVLMIGIAGGFAYAKVQNPDIRIIPVVLGIANYILGPMLGVFLIGMFTKNRGSDTGNLIALICGLFTTGFLSPVNPFRPSAIPPISFTWFALIGAAVVFAVGVGFRTPDEVLEQAKRRAEEAVTSEDVPIALREQAAPSDGLPEYGQRS
jgi:SSS family solute:Na+ symporter